ncbi:DUF3344 domain-containing protein [Streptomyces sp. CAU 1734]|uniref:DUF3344 domain-containing protein n=1 Tax=Streptomyces sp. CAU 1734 TaxID=3140360 RepID=UPI00326036FC
MPKPAGLAARGFLSAVLLLALSAAPLTAAPLGVDDVSGQQQSERIPFGQRYQAVQHGGVTRTANSVITCRTPKSDSARSCSSVRDGAAGVNGDFEMYYIDEDEDSNTYNSSRGELSLPKSSTVTYARLYWGGNLLAGEQKPPEDNGRVLIAENGGEYKEVLADTRIAHRDVTGEDAFQASADITPLIRRSGAGIYTVAQINVAMGNSRAGAWGGWTLVAAYENATEPLRTISVWDGFETLEADRKSHEITLPGVRIPAGAKGRAGLVGYDGDRGFTGDSVSVRAGNGKVFGLSGPGDPAADLMNSTINGPDGTMRRQPAHGNTLGYDSDVFDIAPALTAGATSLAFRFEPETAKAGGTAEDVETTKAGGTAEDAGTAGAAGSQADGGYHLGVLFVQADTRR